MVKSRIVCLLCVIVVSFFIVVSFCASRFNKSDNLVHEPNALRMSLSEVEECFSDPLQIYMTEPRINESVPDIEEDLIEPEVVLEGPDLYRSYIDQICKEYYPDVDPYVALAVMETESNYKPYVRGSSGSIGLMQWIPKWHAWRMEKFNLNDAWDPYTNIIVGIDFLNELYQKNGVWSDALYGYNHSRAYVSNVLERAEHLRECEYFG